VEWIQAANPARRSKIGLVRDKKAMELTATLGATSKPMNKSDAAAFGGRESKAARPCRPALAKTRAAAGGGPHRIRGLKHNDKIEAGDWENALFSKTPTSARTPRASRSAVASMIISWSNLREIGLEGKVFDWIGVAKARRLFPGPGTNNKNRSPAGSPGQDGGHGGKGLFKDFDGFIFLSPASASKPTPALSIIRTSARFSTRAPATATCSTPKVGRA